MGQVKLDAANMLERTIRNIEEKYPNEIDQCYKEISDASDVCKFSTKIELTPACSGIMKKYFMYKGYNAKLTGNTLELAWNVNFDGSDMNNIMKDRALLRAFI